MKSLILAALATLAATGPAAAAPPPAFTGKAIAVSDGDTLTVLAPGDRQTRVRLHGIDAPEKGQPFGTRARQHLGASSSARW